MISPLSRAHDHRDDNSQLAAWKWPLNSTSNEVLAEYQLTTYSDLSIVSYMFSTSIIIKVWAEYLHVWWGFNK